MKRIFYAGGSALASNDVADAVLAYAEALARNGPQADIITFPVVLDSGHAGEATFLIGPASQLFSLSEEAEMLSIPEHSEVVRELRRKTRLVGSPRPMTHAQGEPDITHESDDYDG